MKTKGLSLLEAHNSGRKYRRANRPDATEFHRLTDPSTDSRWLIPVENALATDYELEPQTKLLTREEVDTVLIDSGVSFITRQYSLNLLFGEEGV